MKKEKNNVVYTDASGGDGVSIGTLVALFDHDKPRYPSFSGFPPKWLEKSNIYVLEIYAACLGAFHLYSLSGRGPSIFFIDNDAALSALIRGTAEDQTASLLISIFWRICTENRITPWLERVCSKNNPADDPSRGRVGVGTLCDRFEFPTCPHLSSRDSAEKFARWQ